MFIKRTGIIPNWYKVTDGGLLQINDWIDQSYTIWWGTSKFQLSINSSITTPNYIISETQCYCWWKLSLKNNILFIKLSWITWIIFKPFECSNQNINEGEPNLKLESVPYLPKICLFAYNTKDIAIFNTEPQSYRDCCGLIWQLCLLRSSLLQIFKPENVIIYDHIVYHNFGHEYGMVG